MADKKSKQTLLSPRATEKSYYAQTTRTYMFFVDPADSKQEIAKKVSDQFNVTVVDVRTLTRKGKKTKYSKGRHAYPGITFRRNHKLAFVTLKEGNSIRVFEEEPTKESKEASKSEEKAKTVSAKEAKAPKKAKADKKADKENK